MSHDPYVWLARKAIETYVRHHQEIPRPKDLPEEMTQTQAGVFVSIKMNHELRGCIGTIMPTRASIADEIIKNAISAATRDPRFDPVRPDELDALVLSVDVLSDFESVHSIDDLNPSIFGIIVRKHIHTGVLLPHLEGVESASQQLRIALHKAGIKENEDYSIERFKVIRHH